MTAQILDGKHVAQLTEAELGERVSALKARSDGRTPVLATILVGDDPASATYVKMKGQCLPSGRHGVFGNRTACLHKHKWPSQRNRATQYESRCARYSSAASGAIPN